MQPKKTFKEVVREGYQLCLPLPPVPGIARASRVDVCTKCGVVHLDATDDICCAFAHPS